MAITRLGPNQSVNLASNVTGTLPVANGGTAITSGFVNGTPAGTLAFSAYRSGSNQTNLANGANTELLFNAETLDDNNVFDVSTGRYTPGIVGTYYVSAHFSINAINSTSDDVYPKIFVNGSSSSPQIGQVRHGGASSVAFTDFHTSAVIKTTNTSDYISVFVYHDAGGDRSLQELLGWYSGFRLE